MQVIFSSGTLAAYKAIATKDPGTIYWTSDTHQIFVGESEYTKGMEVLDAAPTSATPGEVGKFYYYNGNLYNCTAVSGSTATFVRVANVNDEGGTVTSVTIGEGLVAGDGTDNPITSEGTIQHAIPTGAAVTADPISNQTPDFGDNITVLGASTDKFGHTNLTTHTVTLPTETAISVESATGQSQTLQPGDTISVVTNVELGAADQSVKRTITTFTLPDDEGVTYTFASNQDGTILVTPSVGDAYSVAIHGWDDLATKSEIAAVFKYKGSVATVNDLPTVAAVGDVYHVESNSAEYACVTASDDDHDAVYEELGGIVDLSLYALSADVIQRVTGATNEVPKFNADGTLSSTGFTLGTSVPADALFTDTTYDPATTTTAGLMSAADKTALDSAIQGVKVNDTALTPDANNNVNVTVASGANDGTIAVNGTDVAVTGFSDLVDEIGTDGTAQTATGIYGLIRNIDVSGDIADAIADLDATESQTAGADGLALSITEQDGIITSISGSIASGTYFPNASGTQLASTVAAIQQTLEWEQYPPQS